jgi:hypothetical protein
VDFEEPIFELRYGSGQEATAKNRADLQRRRLADQAPSAGELFSTYPAFADAVCVFISGSVTRGWTHAKSDLDVFVVSKESLEVDPQVLEIFEQRISTLDPVIRVAIGEIGQFRADIELWREMQIDELIRRFAVGVPGQDIPSLDRTEKELIYRLTSGVPLSGDIWWAQRRGAILTSSYGLWLSENCKLAAEGMLEDVSGMLESGDAESAALAAREGFCGSLEALLAVYGDYSSSRKWLFRRIQDVRPSEVTVEEAWETIAMSSAATDPASWAKRTANLAQSILLAVERRSL